jgi:hypothetical protein
MYVRVYVCVCLSLSHIIISIDRSPSIHASPSTHVSVHLYISTTHAHTQAAQKSTKYKYDLDQFGSMFQSYAMGILMSGLMHIQVIQRLILYMYVVCVCVVRGVFAVCVFVFVFVFACEVQANVLNGCVHGVRDCDTPNIVSHLSVCLSVCVYVFVCARAYVYVCACVCVIPQMGEPRILFFQAIISPFAIIETPLFRSLKALLRLY